MLKIQYLHLERGYLEVKMENKLKPCPFCGEDEAEVVTSDGAKVVRCGYCSAKGEECGGSFKLAVQSWNTRAEPKCCGGCKDD